MEQYSEGNRMGKIYNIQKFSIHDGRGIRTTVFMKGCPLRCIWCCNPESISGTDDIFFSKESCIGCRKCISACPYEAYEIDRTKCRCCGRCAEVCPGKAKKVSGRKVSVSEVLEEVEKDRLFYKFSQGGITISGGEPLIQHEFAADLLERCQYLNIHTAIETSAYAAWDIANKVFTHVDQIFIDIKHMNHEKHRQFTGVDNRIILDNIQKTARLQKNFTVRVPIIPGCNDDEVNLHSTAKFVSGLSGDNVSVELLPYHRLGETKYEWLGREYVLKNKKAPTDENIRSYEKLFLNYGCKVVKTGKDMEMTK